ncbi:MAG: hypothetical protein QXS17_02915 [Candidatus Micrarchaeaceae archaeon]
MGSITGKSIQNDLFLVRPRHMSDVRAFAERVIDIKGVKQLIVGEGDYGIAITANKECKIGHYLSKNRVEYARIACIYAIRGRGAQNGKVTKKA